jgi:hypothetical protein
MKTRNLLLTAAILAATMGTALAQAPAAPAAGGGMAVCRDDMQKFCADKTGPDRRACMEANKDKLSDACKAARAARMSTPGQ